MRFWQVGARPGKDALTQVRRNGRSLRFCGEKQFHRGQFRRLVRRLWLRKVPAVRKLFRRSDHKTTCWQSNEWGPDSLPILAATRLFGFFFIDLTSHKLPQLLQSPMLTRQNGPERLIQHLRNLTKTQPRVVPQVDNPLIGGR